MIAAIMKDCLPAGQFWRENKMQVQLPAAPGLDDTPGFICMDLLFLLAGKSQKNLLEEMTRAKYWKITCQEGRAWTASKMQGPDMQEQQVSGALSISELGLGSPGIKMSRGWSRWGPVGHLSNLGLYPLSWWSQILSLGPVLDQPTNIYWAPAVDILVSPA